MEVCVQFHPALVLVAFNIVTKMVLERCVFNAV